MPAQSINSFSQAGKVSMQHLLCESYAIRAKHATQLLGSTPTSCSRLPHPMHSVTAVFANHCASVT